MARDTDFAPNGHCRIEVAVTRSESFTLALTVEGPLREFSRSTASTEQAPPASTGPRLRRLPSTLSSESSRKLIETTRKKK